MTVARSVAPAVEKAADKVIAAISARYKGHRIPSYDLWCVRRAQARGNDLPEIANRFLPHGMALDDFCKAVVDRATHLHRTSPEPNYPVWLYDTDDEVLRRAARGGLW